MTSKEWVKSLHYLKPYQIEKVSNMVAEYLSLNKELDDIRPTICPKCGAVDAKFIKKGIANRRQRFQCKCCNKKFTYDTMQLTSHSHQPVESWLLVLNDTLSLTPIWKTEQSIGVCHTTALYMRHKLLAYLELLFDDEQKLNAMVEADETYVPESQKGVKVKHRKPRKHGEGVGKRGISSEQLCVCVATDRDNHVVAKCVNRARPTSSDIEEAIGSHIDSGSVIMCDGAAAYNELVKHTQSQKVELKGRESYDKVYHLNTVNGLHSRFKAMIRQYRGVSTKYLNRYLALFMVLSCSNMNMNELADGVRRKLGATRSDITAESAKTLRLLTI